VSEEEQAVLEGVVVRPLAKRERDPFDQRLIQDHYLHRATLVGEHLRYVAEDQGRWVALLTWNAAAFNLRERERWIGWSRRQKQRRLSLVVNNSRFLVLPDPAVPNLASRVMKLCLARLNQDWQEVYGHEVLIAESFVDGQWFRGTCYQASGWTWLGQTQGYGRHRQDYYVEPLSGQPARYVIGSGHAKTDPIARPTPAATLERSARAGRAAQATAPPSQAP